MTNLTRRTLVAGGTAASAAEVGRNKRSALRRGAAGERPRRESGAVRFAYCTLRATRLHRTISISIWTGS